MSDDATRMDVLSWLMAIPEKMELWTSQFFRSIGHVTGRYPWPSILIPVVLSILLSVGFLNFKEINDVRTQFTPINSASHYEHAVSQEFFQEQGQLFYLWIMLLTQDESASIIDPTHLIESQKLLRYLQKGLSIEHNGNNYTYFDVCEGYCNANDPLSYFLTAFKNTKTRQNPNFKLKYPIMEVFGESMYLGSNLFGVKTDEFGNIESAKILELLFFSVTNETTAEILTNWELKVNEYINGMNNQYIRGLVNSEMLVQMEVRRTGVTAVPYMSIGCLLVATFTIITSFRSELHRSKPWEALAGVAGPMLASMGSFGLLLLCGLEYQPIVTITVFLILAVGVDDVFLMLRAWQRSDPSLSVGERMGETLAESGPSITITSLTNALSFGVGILSDTPAICTFCTYTATAIVLSYIFQISFFSGVLALSGRREQKGLDPCCCLALSSKQTTSTMLNLVSGIKEKLLRLWISLLTKWPTRIFVILLLCVYWAFAVWGFLNIRVEISLSKLVMADSPLREYDQLHMSQVWTEIQQLTVFVNKPGDLRRKRRLNKVKQLVQDFENATNSVGEKSTQFWLYPYLGYLDFYDIRSFSYSKLPEFLLGGSSNHWITNLNYNETACVDDQPECVTAFLFTTGYANATEYYFRKQLIDEWRRLSANYSSLNVSIYESASHFADQVTSIASTTRMTVFIALGCMALVCLLFIPSLVSIACAALCVLSINLGVIGYLSNWNVDLDPLSMASLLMAIGFSVDFTAHMSYHYYKGDAKDVNERLTRAFESIAWPTIQAGVSTLLVVAVLFIHSSYLIVVFGKTLFLVVSFGLMHGLFILPVALAALPSHKRSEHSNPSSSATSSSAESPRNNGRWLARNSLRHLWKTNAVGPEANGKAT